MAKNKKLKLKGIYFIGIKNTFITSDKKFEIMFTKNIKYRKN